MRYRRRREYAPHVFAVYATAMTILAMLDDQEKIRFYGFAILTGGVASFLVWMFKK